ncbi:MAG: dihydrolipoamide acetyltransferase family protein [Acidimicrobiia bacterium]
MSTREIRLPALSATMEEATLLEWKVAPGDTVTEGQPIAEVSTDKVDMDLEAPFGGTIVELLVEAGTTVALGQSVATLEADEDDMFAGMDLGAPSEAPPPPEERPEPAAAPAATSRTETGIVPASPPARKMARELGVDLGEVEPTGARGQVTPLDVKNHHEKATAPNTRPVSTPQPAAVVAEAPSAPAPVSDAKRLAVRRATVDVMNRTATVPQFTLWRTLHLDRAAERKGGVGWTTLLVRSLAAALETHPELNARWDDEQRQTVPFPGRSVGIAVDRPGLGLVVATLADPSSLDPEEADRAVRALVDRARTGKIRPEDMAQASITLSNLGGMGVDRFNALLFPPQAAILSIGSIRHRPVATGDGALKAVLTAEVGLTVDHRVADGADGARYLDTFARLVEAGG